MEEFKYKCRCNGVIELLPEKCAITHTNPACKDFDAIDLDELIKVKGKLAVAIHKLTIKAQG